jgi:hypothetical protein
MLNSAWQHVCLSVRGTSHAASGAPCQDDSRCVSDGLSQDTVILALSDGAGSATHAEKGARIVTNCWIEYFSRRFVPEADPAALLADCSRHDAMAVLDSIREAVALQAGEHGAVSEDFSATLLGAVVTASGVFVAQVGDGCWVANVNGVTGCVTWPTGGEFVGQTTFATCARAGDALQTVLLQNPVSGLAGFTDGMERLLLDFSTHTPALDFFNAAFNALRVPSPVFSQQLTDFLESEGVCASTNDDKSFGIITRLHDHLR